MSTPRKKLLTLSFVHDDSRVLLGMKKRGFGAGRWNGFGGKVQEGETIEGAAMRELEEESGITPSEVECRGVLTFVFKGDPMPLEVHVFSVTAYEGEPRETEEMAPKWFLHGEIPYDSMWPDDKYWLPLFLKDKQFVGEFVFSEHTDKPYELLHYSVKETLLE